ncbi:MAG: sigma-54-dependent transcriptional regulator [Bryobacteraceae bacterium]
MSDYIVTLLAVDDDPASLELVREALDQEDLEILTVDEPCAGLELVKRRRPDIVLLDLMMPGMTGLELLERILDTAPETEVILVTGHYSTESAVEAIRKGAADYLNKPVPIPLLRKKVADLIAERRARRRALDLDREMLRASQFEGMVGRSPAMLDVFARIRRAAPHFRTALITGPSGTGKELVARAMHRLSPVSDKKLAVCNCSAIVETLFESELFGYVKGAFTGAQQDKMGLFEYAAGGTVFLDEIGDMPLVTQSKLLRVLESGEFQRVGSPVTRKADVRVVAATNRDLRELMAKGQFREDLYYRLSMLEIRLPRLADRKEDLPLLVRYFLERFSAQYGRTIRGLTPRAQALLSRHAWPGNVRELQNTLGHACMMAESDLIDARDLPEQFRGEAPPEPCAPEETDEMLTLAEVHRRHAMRVLERVEGNKAKAAKILGIHRATLYRLIEGKDEPEESIE